MRLTWRCPSCEEIEGLQMRIMMHCAGFGTALRVSQHAAHGGEVGDTFREDYHQQES
jgi:hypothetical protein